MVHLIAAMERWVASLPASTLAIALPYAVALALVTAEVAWIARKPGTRRKAVLTSAGTGLVMGVVAMVVGFLYTAVLKVLWSQVARVGWESGIQFWQEHPILGAAVTFVAWDLAGWAYHLVGHRTAIGWAAHQPHHSGTDFDSTLGLRQTWAPFHGLAIHPLLALFGFDLRVVIVCAAISNSWQILEHSSVPIRFPRWFSENVMTPAAHRHHHGQKGGGVNLGPIFTWWDKLAGTWVPGDAPAPVLFGPSAPTNNPLRIELLGWRDLIGARREKSRALIVP